jgi:hypothetical protein
MSTNTTFTSDFIGLTNMGIPRGERDVLDAQKIPRRGRMRDVG